MDDKPLNILYWNARGLIRKKNELAHALKEFSIGVCLINETHLTPKDSVKFANYHIYRNDDTDGLTRHWHGLAVLVRRNIIHQQLPDSENLTGARLQTLGVEILLAGNRFRLFAAYRSSGPCLGYADLDDLDRLLKVDHTLIAGDFNAKHEAWGNITQNLYGIKLHDFAEANGYVIVGPDVPTYYPSIDSYRPSVIDIVVTNSKDSNMKLSVIDDDMGSDHVPVVVELSATPCKLSPPPSNFPINWDKFQSILIDSTPSFPVTTKADADKLASDLSAAIKSALEGARVVTKNSSVIANRSLPPIPADLRSLIRSKRHIRRLWQDSRCPVTKSILNRLAAKIKLRLADLNTTSWVKRIEEAVDDWPSMHRLARSLCKRPDPVRPLLGEDNKPRYREEDRAEIFSTHLEKQFSPPVTVASEVHQSHYDWVTTHVASYMRNSSNEPPFSPPPPVITPGVVRRIIARVARKKSPGPDGVPNAALKRLSHFRYKKTTHFKNKKDTD